MSQPQLHTMAAAQSVGLQTEASGLSRPVVAWSSERSEETTNINVRFYPAEVDWNAPMSEMCQSDMASSVNERPSTEAALLPQAVTVQRPCLKDDDWAMVVTTIGPANIATSVSIFSAGRS
jgi:hypothetical protein